MLMAVRSTRSLLSGAREAAMASARFAISSSSLQPAFEIGNYALDNLTLYGTLQRTAANRKSVEARAGSGPVQ
jgi:hypothetical protein